MSRKRKMTILLIVPVTVRGNGSKAMRYVIADVKRGLFAEISSAGVDGWATARTGRVREVKNMAYLDPKNLHV